MNDRPLDSAPLTYGVDFVITLNGEVIDGVRAAHCTVDDQGAFGWIETPSGVVFGCVEFRPLHA